MIFSKENSQFREIKSKEQKIIFIRFFTEFFINCYGTWNQLYPETESRDVRWRPTPFIYDNNRRPFSAEKYWFVRRFGISKHHFSLQNTAKHRDQNTA